MLVGLILVAIVLIHLISMCQVYALTKERDTLRREQSRKSDAAALLKEKDEIINQVMAEGEPSKKTPKPQSFLFPFAIFLFSALNALKICLSK